MALKVGRPAPSRLLVLLIMVLEVPQLWLGRGLVKSAEASLTKAQADQLERHLAKASQYSSEDKADLALKELRLATALDPSHQVVWFELGLLQTRRGEYEEALKALEKAKAIVERLHTPKKSGLPQIHFAIGEVHLKMNNVKEALHHFESGAGMAPPQKETVYYHRMLSEKLIEHSPVSSWSVPGSESSPPVCHTNNYAKSVKYLKRVIKLFPSDILSMNSISKTLFLCHDYENAIKYLQMGTAVAPDNHVLWYNLGTMFMNTGNLTSAIHAFKESIRIKPSFAQAYFNLASVSERKGDLNSQLIYRRKAAELEPTPLHVVNLFSTMIKLCSWEDYNSIRAKVQQIITQEVNESPRINPPSLQPFESLLVPGFGTDIITRLTGKFAALVELDSSERASFVKYQPHRAPHRIGYLSSKFGETQLGHLLQSFFAHHGRNDFIVYCLSLSPNDQSDIFSDIQGLCENFVDLSVSPLDDYSFAKKISDFKLDVLIDLNGWTKGHRYGALAHRLAPIQINWLEYPSTSAASFMDYIVLDPIIAPPGENNLATEKIIRLPGTYQVNAHKSLYQYIPSVYMCHKNGASIADCPTRSTHGLPDEKTIVFCNFNQLYKIDPSLFASWVSIAKKVPDSVLWLLRFPAEGEKNLRHEWDRANLDPSRLVFGDKQTRYEHMNRIGACDVFLDNWVYSSHGTATDALWVGVPLVTLYGDKIANRVASSLLHAVGIPELITHTTVMYEQTAVRLAKDISFRREMQHRLHRARSTSELFDTETQAKHLESLLRRILGPVSHHSEL